MKQICITIFTLLVTIFTSAQQNDIFYLKVSEAACSIIDPSIVYDPSYTKIKYPGGDISEDKGVCTDVVIRTYRRLGIDLQQEVHEDMSNNFIKYPSKRIWGLSSPDTNIDHRRVPNLQVFFSRKGQTLPISNKASDYHAGDIVTWDLGKGMTHIGIVINKKSARGNPLIVHNIGSGQIAEDLLFRYKITGHYRYRKQ